MKSLKDRFTKAPYGFVDDDVEWIVAHLFKEGQISLTLNGAVLTLSAANGDEIARYITKREFLDKLLTSRKEHPKPEWVRMVREIMRELFGNNAPTEDEDGLMRACRKACADLAATLANRKQYDYVKPYPQGSHRQRLALLRPWHSGTTRWSSTSRCTSGGTTSSILPRITTPSRRFLPVCRKKSLIKRWI
mgnify:FL=1